MIQKQPSNTSAGATKGTTASDVGLAMHRELS
jgi:hypothetical protein